MVGCYLSWSMLFPHGLTKFGRHGCTRTCKLVSDVVEFYVPYIHMMWI